MIEGLTMKYFVLNPHKNNAHGEASRTAIYEYANSIQKENPNLASDLRAWITSIDCKMAKEAK